MFSFDQVEHYVWFGYSYIKDILDLIGKDSYFILFEIIPTKMERLNLRVSFIIFDLIIVKLLTQQQQEQQEEPHQNLKEGSKLQVWNFALGFNLIEDDL